MTTPTKRLFWFSIFWIILCVFILTIGQYLPFEICNENFAKVFYTMIWFTLPICILLTLIRRDKKSTKPTIKILTIVIAVGTFLFLAVYVFGMGMCGYITDDVLFINKSDTSLKIVKRHYDCGAYDSDMPKYEFYKMKPLTKQILYSKKIDTLQIDKKDWIIKSGE